MSSTSDSFEHTASEGTPVVVVPRSMGIVDEFKPKTQTSGSHPLGYTDPIIRSKLTCQQLNKIKETYGIPNDLGYRLPLSGETVGDADEGEVAFYPYLFKLGVWITLHPLFCRFLTFFKICPTQLTPNGWVVLLGVAVLSHLSGLSLDIHVFRSFLSLKHKFSSGYYIKSDPNYQVISDSHSAHKRWEEYFFFIRGLIGEVAYKFEASCKTR